MPDAAVELRAAKATAQPLYRIAASSDTVRTRVILRYLF